MLVHVGEGLGEHPHDLVVDGPDDLVQLAAGPTHVLHLLLEEAVPLLERAELLEGQGVDGAERRQLRFDGGGPGRGVDAVGQGVGQAALMAVSGSQTELPPQGLDGRLLADARFGQVEGQALQEVARLGDPALRRPTAGAAGRRGGHRRPGPRRVVATAPRCSRSPRTGEPRGMAVDDLGQAVHGAGVGLQTGAGARPPGRARPRARPDAARRPGAGSSSTVRRSAKPGDADLEIPSAALDLGPAVLVRRRRVSSAERRRRGGIGGRPLELGQPPVELGQPHRVAFDAIGESGVVAAASAPSSPRAGELGLRCGPARRSSAWRWSTARSASRPAAVAAVRATSAAVRAAPSADSARSEAVAAASASRRACSVAYASGPGPTPAWTIQPVAEKRSPDEVTTTRSGRSRA